MTINAVEELEKRGYVFTVTEKGLIYQNSSNYNGADKKGLLERIKANKPAAIQFLKSRQVDEFVKLEDLPAWLEAHGARITGQSWLDSKGRITVHVEDRE